MQSSVLTPVRRFAPARNVVGGYNPGYGFCTELGISQIPGFKPASTAATTTTTTTTTTTSTTTTTTTTAAPTPPARVQSVATTATNGSVSPTWGAATTTGNLLVAVVRMSRNNAAGIPQVTASPTGWVLADDGGGATASGTSVGTITAIAERVSIYYKANAASETANGTWTCSNFMGNASLQVVLIEISGCATSSPVDKTQNQTDAVGTSVTSGSTGTTSATSMARAIAVGGVMCHTDSGGFTGPTNSFTIDANTPTRVAAVYKVLSATGAQSCTVSWTNTGNSCGAIAVFKGV